MLKWLQSNKKQNQGKQTKKNKNQAKLKTQSKEQANAKTNKDQLTEHIRIIAADHPEQTVQLLKQWLKE